ncbi:MAG: MFS transporter, partial [Phaeovulum sp.]|uniref:MFS transporter n=1 Tax=Phaeovulum sp. TaxID=2934796 RepID=UPI002734396E
MQNTPYDSRRLARFIAASGLTNLADGIAVLAWAWVASLITRDALWIALVPIALRSPWFLFAIPAGIVTDRAERRRLILAADTVRVVAFALVTPGAVAGIAAAARRAAWLAAAIMVLVAWLSWRKLAAGFAQQG